VAAFTLKHGDRALEGYTIQRAVGRGGFGEVYYALSDSGREVALKYLRDNPAIELRGVSHCINLKSPHLVTIFDVKQNAEGEYFVIMEYVQGPSLRDLLIAEPDGLGPQKAAFFIRELAKGLGCLHDRGVVHRDMKPGNIFYEDGYVKIGDYGLSKFISVSRHSAQTASIGTVHYMAPEIGSGNYHRGIDIYALGVILYEMLLGRVPYDGATMGEVLMKHLTAQPEVDQLPEPFGRIIRKALEKDPKDRYQTVDEMAQQLLGVDQIKDSLACFDTKSLASAARQACVQVDSPVHSPHRPPHPPLGVPVRPRIEAVRARTAMRDLAGAADGARKDAAAGRPRRTPVGEAARLSPEAATGHLYYAGFWVRVIAAFIDAVIVGAASSILAPRGDVYVPLAILYSGVLLGKWNGQTLGKKALGIKVISAGGRPCGLGQAFGRSAAEILSMVTLGIGYLIAAFDHQKRALHDHMAGTLHVYALERQWTTRRAA